VKVRAVYRWRVKPGRDDEFVSTWAQVTRWIRSNVKGARGSLLMRSRDNPDEYVALARWDSLEEWQAAREAAAAASAGPDPQAANAEFLSAEPLEVIEDLLDYGP
jgi:heme-degrading monooxygenase HmoA